MNDWNIKVLEEIPDIYCFAAYHPGDEKALEVAASALEHPRVLRFKLQLLVQRFYPHDEWLFPMYEMVIEKKKFIPLRQRPQGEIIMYPLPCRNRTCWQ